MQDIVSFLMKPSSYPHEPEEVDHVETHISHVFIAKPYVYKVKKPVDFGFLDFTSFEDRKYYTYEELRLNSRTTPDAYLGVNRLLEENGSYSLSEDETIPDEKVAAFVLKMKYLPHEYCLKNVVKRGGLNTHIVELVARKIYNFHAEADNSEGLKGFGGVDEVRTNALENFDQLDEYMGTTIDPDQHKKMRAWTDSFINEHEDYFKKRNSRGFVKDCHGDLHLEHLYYMDGDIKVIDCIEFNRRLRYIDTIADTAFLIMDMDVAGEKYLSNYLLTRYIMNTGDYGAIPLIRFYLCYRAMVRGKINSFQTSNEGLGEEQRNGLINTARDYFNLAESYMTTPASSTVYVVFGRIGSGKSTVAAELAGQKGGIILNTDAIRKKMAGLDIYQDAGADAEEGIYTPEMTRKVYTALQNHAVTCVEYGHNAIIDATYWNSEARADLYSFFNSKNIPIRFVQASCDEKVILERVQEREKGESVSDADTGTIQALQSRFQEPGEEIPSDILDVVDTGGDVKNQVKKIQ